MKPLTARQHEIYDLIKQHIIDTGMPPTRVEIARQLGFRSANAAEEHLKALARKGAIEMIAGSSRGIRLLLDSNNTKQLERNLGIPLIGKVAAGSPILAEEHIEKHYDVAPSLFKPHADFLLRVEGMSMKNIGILDGDLLAVHKTQHVRNGQIIVARIGDDVTVKRFEKKGHNISLIAENEDFSPIIIDLSQQDFSVEGIAVGIIRNQPWI